MPSFSHFIKNKTKIHILITRICVVNLYNTCHHITSGEPSFISTSRFPAFVFASYASYEIENLLKVSLSVHSIEVALRADNYEVYEQRPISLYIWHSYSLISKKNSFLK